MDWLDMGMVRGVIAAASLMTFLGICWWAYRPANRGRFENDGWLVFESEEAREQVPLRNAPANRFEEGTG
jgi:cytochrome c oxidase cbb3-type subunit 4